MNTRTTPTPQESDISGLEFMIELLATEVDTYSEERNWEMLVKFSQLLAEWAEERQKRG